MVARANSPQESHTNFVGRSVLRLEDPPLLTGEGRFVNDLSFPDQPHMRVVRSAARRPLSRTDFSPGWW